MFNNAERIFFFIIGIMCAEVLSLSETGGIPTGGMGTGYVKYNARSGEFAVSGKIPPAASDMENEFSQKKSISSGFHLFAGGKSVIKARTNDESAHFPLYTARYTPLYTASDEINKVNFSLKAFCPFIPGDNPLYYQLATSPLAFFEITAENSSNAAVDVAVAMEFTNRSALQNLLGGADTGTIIIQDTCSAVSYSGNTLDGNAYLLMKCDGNSPVYSAGFKDSFAISGDLASSTGYGNCVSAKCIIPPGESVRFKFTLAWWRLFVSDTDRYGTGVNDSDNYYYHNFYTTSGDAAHFGEQYFNLVRDGVTTMVNRTMGSNFPEWYKERLLNNLYPMVNNAICAKDGRTAFWEGQYPVIGSIDQAQHASLWFTFNWPKNQWHELQYWSRTAHTGINEDTTLKGQIHHDFNQGPEKFTFDAHFMCPWDNYLRNDYWYCPNSTTWSDLNVMAIFKLYELMLATGDRDSLLVYYPKILLTAERLLLQCTQSQSRLPLNTRSTYDSDNFILPQYVSGISLVAFLAMEELAKFSGDTLTAQKFREWYTAARSEFRTVLFNTEFCNRRSNAEGDIAGYSWGNFFSLESIMDADVINTGCQRLWNVYAVETRNKLGSWHFYTCDHWGGAEIARGAPDTAMSLFKLDYDYHHDSNRSYVFWQSLWNSNKTHDSYVTAPSAWRSYFQMTGYMIDNANNRLWIRPKVPSSMEGKITNAPLPNPGGWGMLNYQETPSTPGSFTQSIRVMFDSLVAVNELVLKNNTGSDTPFIKVNNLTPETGSFTVTTQDWGIEKNIRIAFATPLSIDKNGISVQASSQPISVNPSRPIKARSRLSILSGSLNIGKPIRFSTGSAGTITVELLSLNGAKLATLYKQNVLEAGNHSFIWNGATRGTRGLTTQIMILRISSPDGCVSRQVIVNGH
ncbi:MAG: hypothetical protein JW915_07040 [Chitinispirillaceae bacterium]|nr:hypothetical protein [Chitinispirillaceae bacterium]